jgi:hypothetical protein
MRYVIAPWSGWEENFSNYLEALNRAKEIIKNDEENMVTKYGYKNPEHLIDEVFDTLEEMYNSITDV